MKNRQKIFLACEAGRMKKNRLRKAFDNVFSNRIWRKSYGDSLPEKGPDAEKLHVQLCELMRNGCALFDLTGRKNKKNNGLNLNVLFELGLALGMDIPTFALTDEHVLTYRDIDKRASDLKGCGAYSYKDKETLLGHLEEAKDHFLTETRKRLESAGRQKSLDRGRRSTLKK
jgi:hypothetical protein